MNKLPQEMGRRAPKVVNEKLPPVLFGLALP